LETWSLPPLKKREERGLRVAENRVSREIFGTNRRNNKKLEESK
jgi:hypothetical protein